MRKGGELTTSLVLSIGCRHTYERAAIEEHFRVQLQRRPVPTSPLTGQPLSHCGLVPNRTLLKVIQDWKEAHMRG
jgi:hypothetical protein